MAKGRHVLSEQESRSREAINQMYEIARNALLQSMESLESQNAFMADDIVKRDVELNDLNREIEQECLIMITTRQPMARDVLEILATLQISSHLERIGDHAKDIANIVKGMDPSDFSGPMNQLSEMASVCNDMFIKVIQAYNDRDENLARVCANEDHDVDDLNHLASSSLLMQLVSQPDVHMHATHLLWIAYHLERIGDLIKNIAERVVFMITSKTPDLD